MTNSTSVFTGTLLMSMATDDGTNFSELKVRVDEWVGAEPPVVDGDEWDDHQQSQSDNLMRNGGWWGKSQALQRQAIYTYRAELHHKTHILVEAGKG
ncbi:hypothetical protein PNOK_0007400 [Pyrrhoderma noxium]|uniref:Uncharacterized protein n=1 Tax=Pyrrhoderma noxium TaxID=2282107 RepID=A0A286UTV5_9AGAM|nr:hypothetical protein PNOK_0007400 [Pyrrhoderma noxium]